MTDDLRPDLVGTATKKVASMDGTVTKARMDGTADTTTLKEEKVTEELLRLAKLDVVAYDREREGAAKQLGIRLSTLDEAVVKERKAAAAASSTGCVAPIGINDTEPWETRISDGAALANRVRRDITRFASLVPGAATLLTLFVIFTHTIGAFDLAPIIALLSPQKRCGKTLLLNILRRLVRRPVSAANITSAALFRTIERWEPTLLIDEADTFLRQNEELRGVLNAGHSRGTGYVIRTVGDDHEPVPFRVFGAKAIASIGSLPDTIMDRSIVVQMRRRTKDEKIERIREGQDYSFPELASQIARWAEDNLDVLRQMDPKVSESLNDRAADNWRPLLCIADQLGGDWPERARRAAVEFSGSQEDDDGDTLATLLLRDIRELLDRHPDFERVASGDVVVQLVALPDRPWNKGLGKSGTCSLSQHRLARMLKPFGCVPTKARHTPRLTPGVPGQVKGYDRGPLEEAFRRYLPVDPPPEASQGSQGPESRENSATCAGNVSESGASPGNVLESPNSPESLAREGWEGLDRGDEEEKERVLL